MREIRRERVRVILYYMSFTAGSATYGICTQTNKWVEFVICKMIDC